MEKTAILRDARKSAQLGQEFLSGIIFGDPTGTYENGRAIHTSYLAKEVEPDVFLTIAGTRYRVENWA